MSFLLYFCLCLAFFAVMGYVMFANASLKNSIQRKVRTKMQQSQYYRKCKDCCLILFKDDLIKGRCINCIAKTKKRKRNSY